MGYRYSLIHNHKMTPDSGGRLWVGFINVILASMLVGQMTMIGFLSLKNPIFSIPTLAPMSVITILHIVFVRPKKMHVANFLPATTCDDVDQRNRDENVFEMWEGAYLQPALRTRELFAKEEIS